MPDHDDTPPGAIPAPDDPAARRLALARLRILDTPRERDFDEIAQLAADLCGTPVAIVSLLDETRQWFKAAVGVDGLSETPIQISFCSHAVATGRDVLVAPDLAGDPRFAGNPLVTGEPHVRFYAGAVLRTPEGTALGTLCVLDFVPRELAPMQVAGLQVLARQVMTQLELRRALRDQRELDALYRRILASAIDYAIIATDLSGRITSWNEGAERLLGWQEAEMLGRTIHDFFTPEDRRAGRPEKEMTLALATGATPDERWHLRRDGSRLWGSGQLMPLRGESGEVAGFLKIVRDRTEMRLAAEERDRTAAALAAGERRWRGLFERMGEGFVVADVVRDEEGVPRDLHLAEINPAFEKLTGLGAAAALGRALRDVVPDAPQDFIALCGAVADAGEPREFEINVPSVAKRWFQGRVSPIDGGQVMILFADVTRRKDSDLRRHALVELGERLRDVRGTPDMAFVAGEVLGRTLDVSRAGYGLVDPVRETITIERDWTAPGVRTIAGVLDFKEHGSYIDDLRRGETVAVPDVRDDPRTAPRAGVLAAIEARSFVNMPVSERGAFVGLFFVNHAEPRAWHEEELTFIRNVADRVRAAVARERAEERQRLLNRELGHRLKNTLAMVQAIAAQTLRDAPTVAAAQQALSARMVALGRAHDILLSGERETARLRELIASTVGILDDRGERFRLSGPDLDVGSRAALSLALMLHELGTNALKYGSLSTPEGGVAIDWRVEGDGTAAIFDLTWQETGGPPVSPPTRRGFGSRLITRGLAGQIGGTVSLAYLPEGVRCQVRSPLVTFLVDEIHPMRTPGRFAD